MCITDFVYEAAEKIIFKAQVELTMLAMLKKQKVAPENVVNSIPTEHEESDEENDETHSAECISINDVRGGGDIGSGIGDSSEPRIPTDEDIAIRVQAWIAATFPLPDESLMVCLSRNTSRPPTQRRNINPEARTAYKRQH